MVTIYFRAREVSPSGMALLFGLVVLMNGMSYCDSMPIVTRVDEVADSVCLIEGETSGHKLGFALVGLGDINGDGLDDVAFIGKHVWGPPLDVEGYILFGHDRAGTRLEIPKWTEWGVKLVSVQGGRWPLPAAGLGDMDGDGIGDMLFGACNAPASCPMAVVFGRRDLSGMLNVDDLAGERVCALHGDNTLEGARNASYGAGDVNGDGYRDLVFGFGGSNRIGWDPDEGVVEVVLGRRPFPVDIDLTNLGATEPGCRIFAFQETPTGDCGGAQLGAIVVCGWDFDRDGIDDIVISAPYWSNDPPAAEACAGAVFVVFGRREWPAALDLQEGLAQGAGVCLVTSRVAWGVFGSSVEAVPDVTGDGVPDLLIGSAGGGGRLCLLSGAALRPGMIEVGEALVTEFSGGTSSVSARGAVSGWSGASATEGVFALPGATNPAFGSQMPGAIGLVTGRSQYPSPFLLNSRQEGLWLLFGAANGAANGAAFGDAVVIGDMTGDRIPDLIVSAPGPAFPEPTATWRGALYVIPGRIDLRGPVSGASFVPTGSSLSGGGRLTIYGRGFDETTEVFLGEARMEVLERPDSRRMVARVPAVAAPTSLPIRLTRGAAEFVFEKQFGFFPGVFPYELDVRDLGAGGCTLTAPNWKGGRALQTRPDAVTGGEDFDGDGFADVLFGSVDAGSDGALLGSIVLLYGSRALPRDVPRSDFADFATIFVSDDPDDELGYNAHLVGDMNGDGKSELVIAAPMAGRVYIVFGQDLPKGEIVIQSLVAAGVCALIEGCPLSRDEQGKPLRRVSVIRAGDMDGNGLRDLGIVAPPTIVIAQDQQYRLGAVRFVMGRNALPLTMAWESLPCVYGKLPENIAQETRVAYAVELGDVDGDGYDDLGMYCFGEHDLELGEEPFSVHAILFGRAAMPAETTIDAEFLQGGATEIARHSSYHTCTLSGGGDQNGDGRDDLVFRVVHNPPWPQKPEPTRLKVLYGGTREFLASPRDIVNDRDFDVVFSAAPGFNSEVTWVVGGRDLTGDGWPELLITDHHSIARGDPPPARALALFGGDLESKAGPLSDVHECSQLVSYMAESEFGEFPVSFNFAGDVNGDGFEDVVAASPARLYIYMNPLGRGKSHPFVRGDANQDGTVNIADAIAILQYLFVQGSGLPCADAGDANDDEAVNIADAVRLLMWLFGTGAKTPLPPPEQCAPDPTGEELDCRDWICP